MNNQKPETVNLTDSLEKLPPLLDARGVRERIAPIGRTLLYQLATKGEIQSVTLGMGKRGKRLWVVSSIAEYLTKRAAATCRPNVAESDNLQSKSQK